MPRIVHIGLGAFHRAHQAVFLQRLHDRGDVAWTLASGNIRPDDADTIAGLQRSGGAYTLETVSAAGDRRYERIQSIGEVIAWDAEHAGLIAAGADAETRIVSFTVTEAGYEVRPGERSTLFGVLASILRERMHSGAGPLTLLCCDNLRHNGERSRAGLLQFLQASGECALAEWVRTHTSSPNAMVDRITPRPTAEVAVRVQAATGIADPAALMTEDFLQWVLEDGFIAGRPAWEHAGVQLVDSVAPFEEAKIRLLNATHSCIAWAGILAGHRFIHEGARDPRILGLAKAYGDEAIAALTPSPLDLPAYRDKVLERFGNAAILDTNQRVAMDSFAKIPGFLVPTVRDRLRTGQGIEATACALGLFLHFLQRWHRGALPFAHRDQAMDEAQAHAMCDSADISAAFAALPAVWGELAGDARLLAALRQGYAASAQVAGQ